MSNIILSNDHVLRLLIDAPEGVEITTKAMADLFGQTMDGIGSRLRKMQKDGLVASPKVVSGGGKVWTITDKVDRSAVDAEFGPEIGAKVHDFFQASVSAPVSEEAPSGPVSKPEPETKAPETTPTPSKKGKPTADQILEWLKNDENGQATISHVTKQFECHKQWADDRLQELKKAGKVETSIETWGNRQAVWWRASGTVGDAMRKNPEPKTGGRRKEAAKDGLVRFRSGNGTVFEGKDAAEAVSKALKHFGPMEKVKSVVLTGPDGKVKYTRDEKGWAADSANPTGFKAKVAA